ncbi:MAG: EAL domain-containing protein [Microthrixaceae bacterium]
MKLSRRSASALVVLGLLVGWITTLTLGGAGNVPPHYFYVPILLAGIRFGASGALLAALASGLLVGPLTYADVASRTPQELSDWGTRLVCFVVIGQILTAIATMTVTAVERELDHLRSASALWAALDRREFEIYFQPIVTMKDGYRVVGTEALVRWNHPNHGLVLPDDFIPLAESSGMVGALDTWVLREACAQTVAWLEDGLIDANFTLSVNVSARELDKSNYAERVSEVLLATRMDPRLLHLEITERELADDARQFLDTLHDLRRLGVKLALDDFGTGHSTLARVQNLPLDVIKIDRSFVTTLGHGLDGGAIAENVVALARSLEVSTVAEGVETTAQAEMLRQMGCDLAQGFLFGQAVPHDDFRLALMSTLRQKVDNRELA